MTLASISRAALTALLVAGVAVPASAQGKSKAPEKKAEKPVVKTKAKDPVVKTAKANEPKVVTRTSNGTIASAKKSDNRSDKANKVANGPKKVVTTTQAVVVTREVLLSNGYQVVNVVPSGATQVIYYRRGNRGNGRGLGPVEKIVVVPSGSVVQLQSVPQPLLATILRRLGM